MTSNGTWYFAQPSNAIGGVIYATLQTPVGQFNVPIGISIKYTTLVTQCGDGIQNGGIGWVSQSSPPSQFCATPTGTPALWTYTPPAYVRILFVNPNSLSAYPVVLNEQYADGTSGQLSLVPTSWGNVNLYVFNSQVYYGFIPLLFYGALVKWAITNNSTVNLYSFGGTNGQGQVVYNQVQFTTQSTNANSYFALNFWVPVTNLSNPTPVIDLSPLIAVVYSYAQGVESVSQYAQALYNLYTQLGLTPQQAIETLGVMNVSILQPLCNVSPDMYNDMMLQLSIVYSTLGYLANSPKNIVPLHAVVSGQWLKVDSPIINGTQYQGTTYLAFDQPRVVLPCGTSQYKGTVIVYNPNTGGTILVNPTITLQCLGYQVFYSDLWFSQGQCHRVPVTQFMTLSAKNKPYGAGYGYVWNVTQTVTVSTTPVTNNGFVTQGYQTDSDQPYPVTTTASPTVVYMPYNVAYAVFTPAGLQSISVPSSTASNKLGALIVAGVLVAGIIAGVVAGNPEYRQWGSRYSE